MSTFVKIGLKVPVFDCEGKAPSKREAVTNGAFQVGEHHILMVRDEQSANIRSLLTQQLATSQLQITGPKAPSDDRVSPKPI